MNARASENKVMVGGLIERDGKVRTHILENRERATMHTLVRDNVEAGANLFTDDYFGYWGLYKDYVHQIVDHAETYVQGKVHTNTIENYWSLVKRGLHGTYVSVEPFHLFRYLDEQSFRFNNRKVGDEKVTDRERFDLALSGVVGKRITYEQLIGRGIATQAN
jgi:hypothetical protein